MVWLPVILIAAAALIPQVPLLTRWYAGRTNGQRLARLTQRASHVELHPLRACGQVDEAALLALRMIEPVLASWGNVGGCGAGGGASAAGGVKWIGRGVTGGLVDVQCLSSHTLFLDGGYQTTQSARVGTTLWQKWNFAVNVPFRLNIQDVDVYGEGKTAILPGWGDLGLEVTRKLGITNASTLTLSLNFPTGSHDAVRQGIVLPKSMQLGPGSVTGGLTYEYTQDHDLGVLIYGLSIGYGGWENSIGDSSASSAGGYLHAGFLIGPLAPAIGFTLSSKFVGDRERYARIPDQPMLIGTFSASLEWSTDWLAVLLGLNLPVADTGVQSVGMALGIQSSLF